MHYVKDAGLAADRRTSQQRIKEENIRSLFNLLNKHRELSRSDLARITGLSPTTVSTLVDELMRENLAVEVGYAHTSQTGRKPINLRINPRGRQIPVLSLGRWGVKFSLYNLQMELLETIQVSLNSACFGGFADEDVTPYPDAGEEYAALFEDILLRQSRFFRPEDALALCISYPGIYIPEGERYAVWSLRVSFRKETLLKLERRLGMPIFISTVAQAMAYAQYKHLVARGENVDELMLVAIWGGIGTGIVQDGQVRAGRNRFTGEIGHMSINYKGRPCICGGRGCLCQHVNVPVICERVRQAVDFQPDAQLSLQAEQLTLDMIGEAFEKGQPAVETVIRDVAAQLAAGLHSAMSLTGIRKIYIGGGVERLGEGFLELIREEAIGSSTLTRQAEITYSHVKMEDLGIGIAQYLVDHVFEIGK